LRAAAALVLAATDDAGVQGAAAIESVDSGPSGVPAVTVASGVAEMVEAMSGLSLAEVPPDPADIAALANRFAEAVVSPRLTEARNEKPRVYAPAPRVALSLLARRADLASRACDWAGRRDAHLASGGDWLAMRPEFDALLEEVQSLQPLYLWMLKKDQFLMAEQWALLSGCYGNLAKAAEVVHAAPTGTSADPEHVRLLAEAQSALYSALTVVDQKERMQQEAFEWCREEGERCQYYIYYLSRNNPADPTLWRGLAARIGGVAERAAVSRGREKSFKTNLNTIQYHVGRILEDQEHEGDHANDWKRIDEALGRFLAEGGQPSNPKLVDLIEPIADLAPEAVAQQAEGLRRVLPFVDQRAAAKDQPSEDSEPDRVTTADLRKARELLRGKRVVMIGGEARRPQREKLERELELMELVWVTSKEHGSIDTFLPDVSRPDTALVILAIRWASHSFEEVKATCDSLGKPFVRLPAGYGVNRVAFEVVRQQGLNLGDSPSL